MERRTKRRNDRARSAPEQRPEMARIHFEKIHVRLDNELLGRMVTFDDPQTTEECAGRVELGKKTRSGRWLDQLALENLEGVEEFMQYITEIGFDWLLDLHTLRMPIELAQEFFTSFHFRFTTDVGAAFISFRNFTNEMRMSIREWSLRLGLYTTEQEAGWFERDIGTPKEVAGFNEQAAWEELVPRGIEAFRATEYRADCIKYSILKSVQAFVGVNLLAQANTVASVTEAELYFMWCMLKQRNVHLGYWITRTCQSISSRASRNLNYCHVLGAIFANWVDMTAVRRIPRMTYCLDPELFGMRFFKNVGIIVQRGGRTHFYRVIKPDSQPERLIKRNPKKSSWMWLWLKRARRQSHRLMLLHLLHLPRVQCLRDMLASWNSWATWTIGEQEWNDSLRE